MRTKQIALSMFCLLATESAGAASNSLSPFGFRGRVPLRSGAPYRHRPHISAGDDSKLVDYLFEENDLTLPIARPANHKSEWLSKWSPYSKTFRFCAPAGTEVTAMAAGEVIFAGWYGGYGKVVIVKDLSKQFQCLYSRLSEFSVQCGQSIERGQKIGLVGHTGFMMSPEYLVKVDLRKNVEVTTLDKTIKELLLRIRSSDTTSATKELAICGIKNCVGEIAGKQSEDSYRTLISIKQNIVENPPFDTTIVQSINSALVRCRAGLSAL